MNIYQMIFAFLLGLSGFHKILKKVGVKHLYQRMTSKEKAGEKS